MRATLALDRARCVSLSLAPSHRASRGVISRARLVACSDARDDPYVALGLVVYEDVRRRDAQALRALRRRLLEPHGVYIAYYNRRPIPEEVSASVMAFFFLFFLNQKLFVYQVHLLK